MSEDTDALRQRNTERLQNLYANGFTLEPVAILKARLDLITDVMFKALGISEDAVEEDWEILVSKILDSVDTERGSDADSAE